MSITQTISTVRRAGKRGVDLRDDFVTNQENFQDDVENSLVSEINSFGTVAQTAANGGNSERVDSSQVFPKGITIYGRWRSFLLAAADSTGGAICYFGY